MHAQHDPEVQQGGRVLVVEDDADIADVLRRSLRNEGYEVRTSADGVEALDVAVGFVPDLVVLDLGLPGLDGIEVCRRLRNEGDVPILMLTARAETEDRRHRPRLAVPTTTWSSRSSARSCWRGSAPCCAVGPPRGDRLARGRRPAAESRHPRGRTAASARSSCTNREFELLEFLMRNERLVVSRERLLDEVWGYDPMAGDQHDRRLHLQPAAQARGRAASRASCTPNAARATSSRTDGRLRT